MLKQKRRSLVFGSVAMAVCLAAAQAGAAGAVEEFYSGKQMKIYVGTAAGGTYDLFARNFAEHFGKHIPGNPHIIVINMPGSGGVKATNYVYNVAPKDGSILVMPEQGVPVAQALREDPGMKFDITKFNWIGVVARSTYLIGIWEAAPVDSIEDAKKQRVRLSSTGKNSTTNIYPLLVNSVLGTRFEPILGYKGAGSMNMAIEQGETMGRGGTWASWKTKTAHWVKSGQIRFILQIGLKSHPAHSKVPLLLDLVKDEETRQMVEFMSVPTFVGRSLAAPPGVPTDRVDALRQGFDKANVDPGYEALLKKHKLDVQFESGKDLQALMVKLSKTPKPMIQKVRDAIGMKKAK